VPDPLPRGPRESRVQHRLSTSRWQATWRQVRARLTALRVWLGVLARLWSCRTLADIIAVLTRRSAAHYLGALALVLNRLVAPRPLYRVMDWLAQTVLSDYLGVPAPKFNDDRPSTGSGPALGRTLDALAAHTQALWQDIASQKPWCATRLTCRCSSTI